MQTLTKKYLFVLACTYISVELGIWRDKYFYEVMQKLIVVKRMQSRHNHDQGTKLIQNDRKQNHTKR